MCSCSVPVRQSDRLQRQLERINGTIALNPDALNKAFQVIFQPDMARLKTEAVVDKGTQKILWNTDVYPQAILRIERLKEMEDSPLVDGKMLITSAEASFKLHGVKKPVGLEGLRLTYFSKDSPLVQWLPGDVLRLVGGFEIQLAD